MYNQILNPVKPKIANPKYKGPRMSNRMGKKMPCKEQKNESWYSYNKC